MRLKVVSGIMLVLFLVSMLSTVVPVSGQWIPEDVNADGRIDIADVTAMALRFGMDSTDPDWDPIYDIDTVNSPGLIDIFDLVRVAVRFGDTAPPPPP